MATDHVKVYEDRKRGGVPIWYWLIPLLLVLALLAWFLLGRHRADQSTGPAAAAAATASSDATAGMPEIGAVHFGTDQAALTPEDQASLTRAADYMKDHPEAHLRVEGYTDSTGSDPHNLTLSQRRAISVEQFLQGQGIDRARLTGEGFGPEKPAASNASEGGKADNRRVELFAQSQ